MSPNSCVGCPMRDVHLVAHFSPTLTRLHSSLRAKPDATLPGVMRRLLILASSIGVLLACRGTTKSNADASSISGDANNIPHDAGSVPVDGGRRDHNRFGNFGLDECLAPDGNIEPTRVCSPSPTAWLRVDNSGEGSDCHGPSDAGSSCSLPWGCGSYDEALASVLENCDAQGLTFHTLGDGWGYRVIQSNSVGAFFAWGFYDGAGSLVGAYSSSDTGPEKCAGTVPNGLYHTDQLSNAVDPCQASDAGR